MEREDGEGSRRGEIGGKVIVRGVERCVRRRK